MNANIIIHFKNCYNTDLIFCILDFQANFSKVILNYNLPHEDWAEVQIYLNPQTPHGL